MRRLLLTLAPMLVFGCYGSIPPEPPCFEKPFSDSVQVETRIKRDLSRRPKSVWQVRQDSNASWIRHGRTIHYFLTGQTSAVEWYRDGKLDGKASYWHENGAKQGEITYVRGMADGIARTWYDDGTIESEKTWKMGRLESLHQFDRRGRPLESSLHPLKSPDSTQPGK
ncbi:MAG: hypothetical protein IPO40_00500 [Fibrobacteres bacterium]|nr:hypothetical protein [Fibrobacterota bacterium]